MSTADRPSAPPSDLLADLIAHDRECQAVHREREEINRRSGRLRIRAGQLAARLLRDRVGVVEIDGYFLWANPDGSGLHRKKVPTQAVEAQRHA